MSGTRPLRRAVAAFVACGCAPVRARALPGRAVCRPAAVGGRVRPAWRPAVSLPRPHPHSSSTATTTTTTTTTTTPTAVAASAPSGKRAKQGGGGRDGGAKRGGGRGREKADSTSPELAAALEKYQPVIGIEVHVQLATASKAFCGCATAPSRLPNNHVCPVCLGHPGSLPRLNARMVELAAKAGMALNCAVHPVSVFDRKNYFYADTPKNYQISQYDRPLATGGHVTLGSGKRIGVTRLHVEEDSGKMSHQGGGGSVTDAAYSLIDYNRAGVGLAEIVSEPEMRSGAEAAEYGRELQRVLRYAGVTDGNMQDGSLRCDVNVSLRRRPPPASVADAAAAAAALDATPFGTKVEVKNVNSFAAVHRGVEFEITRQAAVLDAGGVLPQETRTWDDKSASTILLRVKEGDADYRYFPEPDLPPLTLSAATLAAWRAGLPELPAEKRARYVADLGLSEYDAWVLADDEGTARYFDDVVAAGADAKAAANWVMGDLLKEVRAAKVESVPACALRPAALAEMVVMITEGVISGKIAKGLLPELVVSGGSPAAMVEERYVGGGRGGLGSRCWSLDWVCRDRTIRVEGGLGGAAVWMCAAELARRLRVAPVWPLDGTAWTDAVTFCLFCSDLLVFPSLVRTCGVGSSSLPRPPRCACAVRRLLAASCRGLKQITDVGAIEAMVNTVLAENQKEVELYRGVRLGGASRRVFFFFVVVCVCTRRVGAPRRTLTRAAPCPRPALPPAVRGALVAARVRPPPTGEKQALWLFRRQGPRRVGRAGRPAAHQQCRQKVAGRVRGGAVWGVGVCRPRQTHRAGGDGRGVGGGGVQRAVRSAPPRPHGGRRRRAPRGVA